MSYIQIEIGGKPRGWKFNKMAQLILEEKIIPGNVISGAYGLIYGGLRANCYVKNVEPDFTFEDVCDWTDLLDDDTLLKVKAAYEEAEVYKKGKAYLAELDAAKKKEVPNHKPLKNIKQKV